MGEQQCFPWVLPLLPAGNGQEVWGWWRASRVCLLLGWILKPAARSPGSHVVGDAGATAAQEAGLATQTKLKVLLRWKNTWTQHMHMSSAGHVTLKGPPVDLLGCRGSMRLCGPVTEELGGSVKKTQPDAFFILTHVPLCPSPRTWIS